MTKIKNNPFFYITIVLGIIFLISLIYFNNLNGDLKDIKNQNYDSSNKIIVDVPQCDYNEVLGEDYKCHIKCGVSYCERDAICHKGICYVYPKEAIDCYNEFNNAYNRLRETHKSFSGKLSYQETAVRYDLLSNKFNDLVNIMNRCNSLLKAHKPALTELGYDVDGWLKFMDDVYLHEKDFLNQIYQYLETYQ